MDKLDFDNITPTHDSYENKIFNLEMDTKANHIANSSVIIHHSIVKKTGLQNIVPRGGEDWDYWKRALQYTDCLHIGEPFVYFTWTVQHRMKVRHYHYKYYFLAPPGVANPFNISVIPLIPPLPVS